MTLLVFVASCSSHHLWSGHCLQVPAWIHWGSLVQLIRLSLPAFLMFSRCHRKYHSWSSISQPVCLSYRALSCSCPVQPPQLWVQEYPSSSDLVHLVAFLLQHVLRLKIEVKFEVTTIIRGHLPLVKLVRPVFFELVKPVF